MKSIVTMEKVTAGAAVAAGVVAGAALVRPLAGSVTADVRLQGVLVAVAGMVIAAWGTGFIRLVGLGVVGQGVLQTAAGLGVALPVA